MTPPPVIRLHENDGVLIARSSLPPGMVVADGVTTAERIPAGHKVAIRAIAVGEPIRRYGQIIGFATAPIAPGQHVHTQNCGMGDFAKDYAFGVDVTPVVEPTDHIEIPEDEIRVDVYRSSGPGGQGVNTTDSAVRLTHLPTGIVVSCQNERSQMQNKATAMAVLQAKLLERKREEQEAKLANLRGESTSSWGTQIRNYVLYPYQNVKDVRTGKETGNAVAVLDGEIDDFIDAEIRWLRQNGR